MRFIPRADRRDLPVSAHSTHDTRTSSGHHSSAAVGYPQSMHTCLASQLEDSRDAVRTLTREGADAVRLSSG